MFRNLVADVLEKLVAYDWPGNVRELKNVAERLIVRCRGSHVDLPDLPPAIAGPGARQIASAVEPELGTVAPQRPMRNPNELYQRIVGNRESFWSAVYEPFMSRDLTRDDVRAIVTAGLQHTRGNYKMLLEMFNMPPSDYKRFLNFLRKHECHMPFHKFRMSEIVRPAAQSKVS